MDYRDNSNFGYDDRDSEYNMQKTLPFSEQSDLSFNQLLKINQLYLKQLTKILDGNSYYKNVVTLPGNDMKVLNNSLSKGYSSLNDVIFIFILNSSSKISNGSIKKFI